jgi:hypothetical protein
LRLLNAGDVKSKSSYYKILNTVIPVILILLFGVLAVGNAFSCTTLEAQFIAKVGKMNYDNAYGCNFDLDYSGSNSQFTPSMVCPLTPGEVSAVGVTIEKNAERTVCPFKTGDNISGYLIRNIYRESPEVVYEF